MSLLDLFDRISYWRDEIDRARMAHDRVRLTVCVAMYDALLKFRAERFGTMN